MSFNSRLKVTKIIGQRKAFCRQRIQESSCARKGTVDIDSHAFYSLFVSWTRMLIKKNCIKELYKKSHENVLNLTIII